MLFAGAIDTARIKLLEQSALFDRNWYATRHGDISLTGLDPWEHFIKIGWGLGRNPGPDFDAQAYMATYSDVFDGGTDALSHYLQHGASEGRSSNPYHNDPVLRARVKSDVLRYRLNVMGQTSALSALERLLTDEHGDVAGFAGRDLALWHLRQWRHAPSSASAETAYRIAQDAHSAATIPDLRRQLLTVSLVAGALARRPAPSDDDMKTWLAADLFGADCWLALADYEATEVGRLEQINTALSHYGLAELAFCGETDGAPYDRLTVKHAPDPVDGPLVSVLIAAHQAEDTLPTALRAMREQSWRNLEIIIIDDASTDGTSDIVEATSRIDPRIRLIRLSENCGAYGARNAGLALARGDFVTLHDADDWCHPERIARQMNMLAQAGTAMASTSEHLRIHSDLTLTRLSPEASFVTETPASLLFRRQPVVDALGSWDTVRVAADNEFIRRLRRVFGTTSVISGKTGPLAMLRDREGSAVQSGPLSINGYITGARLAYLDAQEHHHRTAPLSDLRYTQAQRPFPAPAIIQQRNAPQHTVSLLLAADFRRAGFVVESCLQLASLSKGPVGLVPLARPLAPDLFAPPFRLCSAVRDALDGQRLFQVCPGESVSTPLLILPDPEALLELPDPMPALSAERVRLLAYHSPVTTLAGSGRRLTRYEPATCETSARKFTGGPLEWWGRDRSVKRGLIAAGAHGVARKCIPFTELQRLLR